MIAVLDASVLISAALKSDSIPERALLQAVEPPWRLVVSHAVESEYRDVMSRSKFDRFVSLERRLRVLDLVLVAAERVEPSIAVRECADPNDDKYLALAAAGMADCIVTGDARHLLSMHPWRGIRVLRPADFLALR